MQPPNNPFADAYGNIFRTPGDPNSAIPNEGFKLKAEYQIADAWKLGGDLLVFGSQYLIHGNANQNQKVPPYLVMNLRTSYMAAELGVWYKTVVNRSHPLGLKLRAGSLPALIRKTIELLSGWA